MIKVFSDFIAQDFADEVMTYVRANCKKNIWGVSNLTYDPRLIESSAPIFSMQLHEKMNNKLKNLYIDKFKEFKNKEFLIEFKLYTPYSYITWHDDDIYLAGSTIYLNREYYKNDGGIFLYKDNKNDIRGIEPKYRSMILNYKDKNEHCVTMISPRPKFLRETLQIFIRR